MTGTLNAQEDILSSSIKYLLPSQRVSQKLQIILSWEDYRRL